ncbi:putative nuclease HARBI1 [Diadema antillarum]|uniref:putative nuclease HARBI1 n=2 Tax=Diadema TaxID=31174 RepID=UPI003A87C5FF
MAAVLQAFRAIREREEYERARRRERVFRDRNHPLDVYNDEDIFRKYRFTREGCIRIIDMVGDSLQHDTRRNHALSPSQQIFVALNFFATGAVIDTTSTVHGITRSTASRVIHRVSNTLATLKDEVIKFPRTMEEVREAQVAFFEISGFPQVVGVVDGTHVRLNGAPLGEREYAYVNRKHFHSINVQIVCAANYKIIDLVARWPGSSHDSRILQNSVLGRCFEGLKLHGLLLGDSGYALRPWIMTPVLNPTTPAENAYNRAHASTRVIIEQVNGQLKHKFRCLLHGMQMTPKRAGRVVTACAILHNLSKTWRQPEVDGELDDAHHVPVDPPVGGNPHTGLAIRTAIIANYFN